MLNNDVTFIVSTFGNIHITSEYITSMANHFTEAKLICVDDGSLVEDAIQLLYMQERFKFLLIKQCLAGKSVALNRAVRLAQTEFVVLSDNDIVFHGHEWLGSHKEILQNNPRVAGVGGYGNPDFLDEQGNSYHEADYWGEPGFCEMVNGGLITLRTDVARLIPQDERFSFGDDDTAWACRVKASGMVLYALQANVVHNMGTNNRSHLPTGGRDHNRRVLQTVYKDLLNERRLKKEVRHFMQSGIWSEV